MALWVLRGYRLLSVTRQAKNLALTLIIFYFTGS